jgi:hypothetical protein
VEVAQAAAIAAAKTDLRDARGVLQRIGSASTHASAALDAELARLEAVQRDLDMQAQEQRRRGLSAYDASSVTDEESVPGPQKGGARQSLAHLVGESGDSSGGGDGWVADEGTSDGASVSESELEHRAVDALGEALEAMTTATAPRWNMPGDSPPPLTSPTGSGRS